MSALLPRALERLIEELGRLPGVGPRTAERYAYHLLQSDPSKVQALAKTIAELQTQVGYCERTFYFVPAGEKLSRLYTDSHRNKQLVAVVEDPLDVVAIEKTGQFKGTYHVLGGAISPIDGIGPEQLHINELVKRLDEDKVEEVILATSATVEGESTALYVQKQIGDRKLKITRLARGLPAGIDLEYADQITLTRALEGRQAV